MKMKLSLNEASSKALIQLLESYEDWIEDSKTPEERQQKLDYVEKVRAMTNSDFGSNFGNNKNLRDQKIDSRESYGWIDELSPEEKENELKDQNLKPEYDFHKNLMRTNFKNPKSTELKVYWIGHGGTNLLTTDNIDGILNKESLAFKEVRPHDLSSNYIKSKAENNLVINSKVVFSARSISTKIINSKLLCKSPSGGILSNATNIQDCNVFCRQGSAFFVKTNIEKLNIRCDSVDLRGCDITNCDFNVERGIRFENLKLDNISIKAHSIYTRDDEIYFFNDRLTPGVSMSIEEFKEKFSK